MILRRAPCAGLPSIVTVCPCAYYCDHVPVPTFVLVSEQSDVCCHRPLFQDELAPSDSNSSLLENNGLGSLWILSYAKIIVIFTKKSCAAHCLTAILELTMNTAHLFLKLSLGLGLPWIRKREEVNPMQLLLQSTANVGHDMGPCLIQRKVPVTAS